MRIRKGKLPPLDRGVLEYQKSIEYQKQIAYTTNTDLQCQNENRMDKKILELLSSLTYKKT